MVCVNSELWAPKYVSRAKTFVKQICNLLRQNCLRWIAKLPRVWP